MNRQREAALNRALRRTAALVLLAGMFVHIGMLSRVSRQNKCAAALEREIAQLTSGAEGLELSINQLYNLENIAVRARQLGMVQPDESQIRVIRVAQSNAESTSTQAIGTSDGEKVLN